ncbi:linker for activation of T-cells family member 1 [Micropterus dolomieu]|uniref:linker for activation of T-cells family member 1 n=1 Tax=Micropterus dolomieu TaxID=147949 RepID=UPI001E8CB913|nr:linker for activation of T-cells family member 1 [Micropterus dolomieu]XP_045894037.1 linker for activation of T-cells family member 1 [Micropterus dolomieu]
MDASWFLWVLAGAVLASMVLLAVVCLHCRNKGPLASIRQASDDYMPSTRFRVIHPSQPSNDLNPSLLSPFSQSTNPGTQRGHRSVTPTETESNASYVDPSDGPDYVNADDADDPPYVTVLPGGDPPLTNQSRASTPSSDVRHDYENVPEREDRDYLNVDLQHYQRSTPDLSAQSDSNDDDDDDDDEGNYVNVPEGKQSD